MAYVSSLEDLDGRRLRLKEEACPSCRCVGCLIKHGFLRGYGAKGSEKVVRGGRVRCSNRNRRGGCGRTFSVLLSGVLRHSMVRAEHASEFLRNVANGQSKAAAWRRSGAGFSASTGYRIWKRWVETQARVRTFLLNAFGSEPVSTSTAPAFHAIAHLDEMFASADCSIAAFQEHFQQSFFA